VLAKTLVRESLLFFKDKKKTRKSDETLKKKLRLKKRGDSRTKVFGASASNLTGTRNNKKKYCFSLKKICFFLRFALL
jgi:hypothetical protein